MSLVKPYLFRPEQRIRNSAGFQAVFDSPNCKVAMPQYLVLIRANQQNQSRLGFVIARKKSDLLLIVIVSNVSCEIVLDCTNTIYPPLMWYLLRGKV